MYRLAPLLALLGLVAAQKTLSGAQCPQPWHTYHSEYLNAERGVNVALSSDQYSYQLELVGEEDTYLTEEVHALNLHANGDSDTIKAFVIVAVPDGNSLCGFGSFHVNGHHAQVQDGCPQVLTTGRMEPTHQLQFRWRAPKCGCVTISATLVTSSDVYFADDDGSSGGPLTKTFCPQAVKRDNSINTLQTNEVEIPDILDSGFYGILEEEEEEKEYEVDPEYGIPIDEDDVLGDDDDEDDDDDDEDSDEELDENDLRKKFEAHGKKGRKMWKKAMKKVMKKNKKKGIETEGADDMTLSKEQLKLAKKMAKKMAKKYTKIVKKKGAWRERWSNMTDAERQQVMCKKVMSKVVSPRRAAMEKKAEHNPRLAAVLEAWREKREALKGCCQQSEEEERALCFERAKQARMDMICSSEEGHGMMRKVRPGHRDDVKEECCALTGEGRYTCIQEAFVTHRKNGTAQEAKTSPEPVDRMDFLCNKLTQMNKTEPSHPAFAKMDAELKAKIAARWQQRKVDLQECCEMHSAEDRLECVEEMREERWDRLCEEDEPVFWGRQGKGRGKRAPPKFQECCEKQDEDRYECFNATRRPHHGPHGGPHGHKGSHEHKGFHEHKGSGEHKGPHGPHHGPKKHHKKHQKGKGDFDPDSDPDWTPELQKERRQEKMKCCTQGRIASKRVEEDAEDACSAETRKYMAANPGGDIEQCEHAFERCCVHGLRKGGKRPGNMKKKGRKEKKEKRRNKHQKEH